MGFHDFYRLSSHAVIFNENRQVLLLKATYADCAWGLPGVDWIKVKQCMRR